MFLFFFNDTATTEIYTLSLHDALPIYFPSQVEFSSNQPHEGSPETQFRMRPHRTFFRQFFNDRLRFSDGLEDRKSTRLNSSHANISYAVFCLKKKKLHVSDLSVVSAVT